MYNRYLPTEATYLPIDTPPPAPKQPSVDVGGKKSKKKEKDIGLGALLSGLKLDDLDTGDVLLLLILLLLFLEGDDMELVITLGLLLLLGLD